MNKLKRYWNQNRRKIIIFISAIVFIIALTQALNNLLSQRRQTYTSREDRIENKQPNQSLITGEKVPQQITVQNNNIIKQFVNYCNDKQIQNAYNLLSDDCKEEFYNDINTFIDNYYNKIFSTQKTYKIELWLKGTSGYTYQVQYYEDNLLATGGSSLENNIEDYITVIAENGEKKINVNGFIQKQNVNKTQENYNITITVKERKIYKNCETYTIAIKNNTSGKITLSEGSNNQDICLLDKNNIPYPSFLNEISLYALTMESKQESNFKIKFNKIYDLNRIVEKLQFRNIKTENEESVNITINL